jgi:flagellin-like protein
MRKESAGVSPVVATILLIAITVVAVGVVLVFISSLPKPVVPVSTSVSVNGAINAATSFTLSHSGGDSLLNATSNIQVRLNGTVENWTSILSNGTDYRIGDVITVNSTSNPGLSLKHGDVITMVYIPTSQQIVSFTVA